MSNWKIIDMLGINKLKFFGSIFLKNTLQNFQQKKVNYTKSKKVPEVKLAYNAIINQKPTWIPVIYSGMVKLPAVYQPKENELLKGFIEYDNQLRSFPSSNFNYHSTDSYDDTFYDQYMHNSNNYTNSYEMESKSDNKSFIKRGNNIKPANNAPTEAANKNIKGDKKKIAQKRNYGSRYQGYLNSSSRMSEVCGPQSIGSQKFYSSLANTHPSGYTNQEMLSNSSFCSNANSEMSWMDLKTYLPQPMTSNHLTTPISANKYHPGFNYAPKFQYHYNYYDTEDFANALLSDNEYPDTIDEDCMDRFSLSPITTSRERLQSGCSQIEIDFSS